MVRKFAVLAVLAVALAIVSRADATAGGQGQQQGSSSTQRFRLEEPPEEGFNIYSLLSRANRDLKARGANADRKKLAAEIFADLTLEELEYVARITEMVKEAGEAGTLYILTPELQSFIFTSSWIAADHAAAVAAEKVREGKLTQQQAQDALKAAHEATLESLKFFPTFIPLLDIAIEEAKKRDTCQLWEVEATVTFPNAQAGGKPHTHKVEGYWQLNPGTREYRASLSDPELRDWTYSFLLPVFNPASGDQIEFTSIEATGSFQDSIGKWEGAVTGPGAMSGILTYNGGRCCSSGRVTGTWVARCISQ